MTLMLQHSSSEIYVNEMIFIVIFFTIAYLKGASSGMHIFLENVSSCIEPYVTMKILCLTNAIQVRDNLSNDQFDIQHSSCSFI